MLLHILRYIRACGSAALHHVCVIVSAWLITASLPLSADAADIAGQGFSSPGQGLRMPPGWEAQAVQYPEDIQHADMVISFGQQTYPALHQLVEQYAREHRLRIVIQNGTCGISAGKLLRKSVDSGTFCCPPGTKDRLPGLQFHTLGISSLAIFVNAHNPVNNLTTRQARRIFQGKLHNWRDLKTEAKFDKRIRPHARLHCKKRPGHWTLLLKNPELFSPQLKEVGVIPDLVAKVGQMVNAVGIETPYMIQTYQKDAVKMLRIDGYSPADIDYVASGNYPFYRTYNMTSWTQRGEQRQKVIKLIAYLREHIETNYQRYKMVPVSKLKQARWQFRGEELVAEPRGRNLAFIPSWN